MIAADGAHSSVRQELGIPMEGRGEIAKCATVYFKADVRSLLRGRNLSVVYVNQTRLLAFFRFAITGDAGFLAVFATFDERGVRETLLDNELSLDVCARLVREALGVDSDYPVSIENVQPWIATAATATSFRSGNVFLAGDAAHVMPPTGGFGGNTGVADVHNLAWKLAMAVEGSAGSALLDTYDEERRPIAALTVEQAYRRYVERVDASLPSCDLAPNIPDTAIELGAVYRSRGIVLEGEYAELTEAPERPSGRPGTRLAHRWLDDGNNRISTLDLAGQGFTLLAGPGADKWIEAASANGSLRIHQFQSHEVATSLSIAENGVILLRPDGVIGWRSENRVPNHSAALGAALRSLVVA
jgi:hypothetical protein